MGFAHMVIGSDYSALEYGKEILGCVAVTIAAMLCELLGAVIDRIMRAIFFAKAGIDGAFIGHKVSGAFNIGSDKRADVFGVHIGNVKAANMAFAFDKSDNGFLFGWLAMCAVAGLAANVGFIGFDNAAATAKRAVVGSAVHSFAYAVTHEPSGFIGHSKHTLDLLGTHALLRRTKQVIAQQPFIEGNFGTLKHRPDRDRVLFAAIVALDEASAMRLSL